MIAIGISWENFSRSGTRECIPYSLQTIFFFYIMTNKISMFYGFPQLFMLPSKQIIYNSNYIKLQLFKYCSTICCSGRVRAPIFLLLFTTSKLAIFRQSYLHVVISLAVFSEILCSGIFREKQPLKFSLNCLLEIPRIYPYIL